MKIAILLLLISGFTLLGCSELEVDEKCKNESVQGIYECGLLGHMLNMTGEEGFEIYTHDGEIIECPSNATGELPDECTEIIEDSDMCSEINVCEEI